MRLPVSMPEEKRVAGLTPEHGEVLEPFSEKEYTEAGGIQVHAEFRCLCPAAA